MAWVVDQQVKAAVDSALGRLDNAYAMLAEAERQAKDLEGRTRAVSGGHTKVDQTAQAMVYATDSVSRALGSINAATGATRSIDIMKWVPDAY